MSLDRAVMMFAGFMILVSVALTHWVHPAWMWFTVFIGANLFQASITGFCPIARLFRRLGLRPGAAFSARAPLPPAPPTEPPAGSWRD
ncbi:DUF2892 domain-containing protein [Brevundimonas sp.]|uniref:YgaP family membrane protein n=1 Tax=Brevundimonas sp. TaxID=1871086 RepID=UPI0035B39E1E